MSLWLHRACGEREAQFKMPTLLACLRYLAASSLTLHCRSLVNFAAADILILLRC